MGLKTEEELTVGSQGGDLVGGNPVGERPEVCGLGREPALIRDDPLDHFLAKGFPEPRDCGLVAELQNARDGVLRVGNGVEVVQVRVPEESS